MDILPFKPVTDVVAKFAAGTFETLNSFKLSFKLDEMVLLSIVCHLFGRCECYLELQNVEPQFLFLVHKNRMPTLNDFDGWLEDRKGNQIPHSLPMITSNKVTAVVVVKPRSVGATFKTTPCSTEMNVYYSHTMRAVSDSRSR